MESDNLHQHHHLQSGCGVSTFNDWSPSIIPHESDYNTYMNEILPNSSMEYLKPKNANLNPHVKTPTIQSNGFYDGRSISHQYSANTLQFGTKNEEISACLPKYSDMINNFSSIEESHLSSTSCLKHDNPYIHENSAFGAFQYGGETGRVLRIQARELYTNAQSCAMFRGIAPSSSYNFGDDHPSTNVSNVALSCSRGSSSLGLNVDLDLLTSTNSGGGSCSQSSHESFGFLGEDMSLGHGHVEESSDHHPSNSSNKALAFNKEVTRAKKALAFNKEVTRAKRHNSSFQPRSSHEATKKSRLMPLSSCPSKVGKEKLGDRIAALHRLVAPFGKTDTASVLTEAIGYIQFLQNQIQKLTVPYMKSSCNSQTIQRNANMEDGEEEEESKQDLRSRGLCLSPLSFTSYLSAYN